MSSAPYLSSAGASALASSCGFGRFVAMLAGTAKRLAWVRAVFWPGLLTASLGALWSSCLRADPTANHAQLAHGEHVARLICSTCHIVAKDQEFPPILNWPTPSFFDIANRPGVTTASLEHFVTATHWDTGKLPMTMPNPQLTKEQTRAVASYILSLRSP